MNNKEILIMYNPDVDCLEVLLEKSPGLFKETEYDSVMEKVDGDGRVIGFSITNVRDLPFIPVRIKL